MQFFSRIEIFSPQLFNHFHLKMLCVLVNNPFKTGMGLPQTLSVFSFNFTIKTYGTIFDEIGWRCGYG